MHRLGLKQPKLVSSQFWRPEGRDQARKICQLISMRALVLACRRPSFSHGLSPEHVGGGRGRRGRVGEGEREEGVEEWEGEEEGGVGG